MGRLRSYAGALDSGDREALGAALGRNLLRGDVPADDALVDFVLVLEQRIAALGTTALLAGHLD